MTQRFLYLVILQIAIVSQVVGQQAIEKKIQTDLISEKNFQKLQNTFDNQFVNANAGVEGIAENLAKYHMLYGDVNLINSQRVFYETSMLVSSLGSEGAPEKTQYF